MKNIFLPIFIAALIFGACNNAEKVTTPTETPVVQSAAPTVDVMETFTTDFKKAVQAHDAKMVSDLCEFPFESGLKQSDFIQDFEMIFDNAVRVELEKFTAQNWIDNANGKKQAVISLSEDGMESQIIFIVDKKGEKYKLVDVLIAG